MVPAEKVAAPRPTSTTLDTAVLSLSDRTERRTPETENTAMKAGPARTLREFDEEMLISRYVSIILDIHSQIQSRTRHSRLWTYSQSGP